jgi:hypothetical protein
MKFQSRIKKELSEGIVRAILDDAGYRVIDSGIENLVRELACLSALEYAGLDYPKAMRALPDLVVMDREQKTKYLVEIKYRSGWSLVLFNEIEEQVRIYKDLVLVYLNSSPELPPGRLASPASYLRCCRLRIDPETQQYEIEIQNYGEWVWVPVSDLVEQPRQWWGLGPLQRVFPQIEERREEGTLTTAIQALQGILNAPETTETENPAST